MAIRSPLLFSVSLFYLVVVIEDKIGDRACAWPYSLCYGFVSVEYE